MKKEWLLLALLVPSLLLAGKANAECILVSTSVTDPKTGEKTTESQLVCWDDPSTGGGWDPGDIFGGPGGPQYCSTLRLNKPADCLGPAPIQGPDFGAAHYVIGSALSAAIQNALNSTTMATGTRSLLSNALSAHTSALSTGLVPLDAANVNLLNGIRSACDYQAEHDRQYPPLSPHPGGVSPALRACLGTLSRASGEAGVSFGSFFADWLHQQGIVLADLGISQSLINWFSPENSLRVRFNLIDQQLRCNIWYEEMSLNGCY